MKIEQASVALVPVAGQEGYVKRRFWQKVRRTLGRVPFVDQAVAAYYAAVDPATPGYAKAVLFAALAYFIMPADMIPDLLAGIGFSDDAAVLMLALQTIGAHVKPSHLERARTALDSEA